MDIKTAFDTLCESGELSRLIQCRIVSIEFRKKKTGVQHEFLRVVLRVPGLENQYGDRRTYTRYICLERGVGEAKPYTGILGAIPQSSQATSHNVKAGVIGVDPLDTVTFSSDAIASDLLADTVLLDTLTFESAHRILSATFPFDTSSDTVISTPISNASPSSFPPSDSQTKTIPSFPLPPFPTLLDLLSVMHTLSKTAAIYRLHDFCCYWMAGTTYETLALSFPGCQNKPTTSSDVTRGAFKIQGLTFEVINNVGQINTEEAKNAALRVMPTENLTTAVDVASKTSQEECSSDDAVAASTDYVVDKVVHNGKASLPEIQPAELTRRKAHEELSLLIGRMQTPVMNSFVSRLLHDNTTTVSQYTLSSVRSRRLRTLRR